MSGKLQRLSKSVAPESLTKKSEPEFERLSKWSRVFDQEQNLKNWISVYKKHLGLFTKLSEKADLLIVRIQAENVGSVTLKDVDLRHVISVFQGERLKLRPFQPLFANSNVELLDRMLQENYKRLTQLIVWINYFRLAVSDKRPLLCFV